VKHESNRPSTLSAHRQGKAPGGSVRLFQQTLRSVRDIYRNFKAGFEDTLIETACGLHNLRSNFPIEAWLKAA